MVLEKLSLDPVIVGTLSVVAVAVLWLMGVRGADLAAAGILIVGGDDPLRRSLSHYASRGPRRIRRRIHSNHDWGHSQDSSAAHTVIRGAACVVLVYSRPLYSNEDTESADDMEEAIW